MTYEDTQELEQGLLKGVGAVTLKNLKDAGFTTLIQVAITPPNDLLELTEIKKIETAAKVVTLAQRALIKFKTAEEYLIERNENVKHLTTGCKEVDAILDGGFETGVITELIGEFGTGKTQMCYTASVLAQLPEEEGGLDGKVLVLDTEKTFAANRVAEIAEARGLDVSEILRNIRIAKTYNAPHLKILVQDLPRQLQEGKYGLVIVDSMIGHFRSEYVGRALLAPRQGLLGSILSNLLRIGEVYNVVVLITNQVQSNVSGYGPHLKAAGGHVMAHAGTHRLFLRKATSRTPLVRILKVYDSPYLAEAEARFKLSAAGIEDVE